MDLEFLIVGIAKGSQEDLHSLYEKTAPEVYGTALSIVKDTNYAAEILAETYKRISTLAYLFNTEMSAEYWLLDTAKNLATNALHDPSVQENLITPKQDNMSKMLMELVNNGKDDRAAIIITTVMSGLSNGDIARLLWYKTGACKQEYKRGLNRLSEKFTVANKAEIALSIKNDIENTCPDVWNKIISKADGPLAHISHEELNLESNELIYSDKDMENALEEKHNQQKRKKKRLIIVAIALGVIVLSGLTALLVNNFLKDKPEEITVDVQFGNKISLVQLGNKVYYQNNDKNNHLWCYDYDTKKATEVCADRLKELITDGEKLYYRNLDDGKIYVINKDGSNKKLLTKTPGTCLNYKDGKIYFSTGIGISSINLDGSEENLIIDISEDSEDYKYYETQESIPFRYSMKFAPDGTLFFSSGAGKGLFYVTDFNEGTGIEALALLEIYTFDFYNNNVYFDYKILDENSNGTIYLYKADMETQLTSSVEGIIMGTGAFYLDGSVMYYDGIDGDETGIFKVDLSKNTVTPEKISDLRASDIYVYGNKLYLYYPGDAENADKTLTALSLDNYSDCLTIF
ncbi:MAG: DUF5050 domain-containing protein [Ruminococcaceae bacterium]|nr:DUF5050 domain-containing protein [Oscillospiraceae bacterium]